VPKPSKPSKVSVSKAPKESKKVLDIDGLEVDLDGLQVVGDGDPFKMIARVYDSASGWIKTTEAMQLYNGCVVQSTHQKRNQNGSYVVTQALTFVPDVQYIELESGGGTLEKMELPALFG